jgi:hypothetical protein
VLAPEQSAVPRHELGDGVGQLAHARLVGRILEIERGAHVQAADVDVPEHAVAQSFGIEQRAKFAHVRLQVLGRHHRVFDEGHGFARAGGVAEQAHALFAQVPQTFALVR